MRQTWYIVKLYSILFVTMRAAITVYKLGGRFCTVHHQKWWIWGAIGMEDHLLVMAGHQFFWSTLLWPSRNWAHWKKWSPPWPTPQTDPSPGKKWLLYGHLLLVNIYTGKNQIRDTIINGSGDKISWNQNILLENYHIMQVYLMSCIKLNLHTSQKYLGERLNRCRSIVFLWVFIITPIYRRQSWREPLLVWREIKTFCWNITISCRFT